jgi:hypothetical protein
MNKAKLPEAQSTVVEIGTYGQASEPIPFSAMVFNPDRCNLLKSGAMANEVIQVDE